MTVKKLEKQQKQIQRKILKSFLAKYTVINLNYYSLVNKDFFVYCVHEYARRKGYLPPSPQEIRKYLTFLGIKQNRKQINNNKYIVWRGLTWRTDQHGNLLIDDYLSSKDYQEPYSNHKFTSAIKGYDDE